MGNAGPSRPHPSTEPGLSRSATLGRRSTIPTELEDPDDCTRGIDESDAPIIKPADCSMVIEPPTSGSGGAPNQNALMLAGLPKEVRNLLAGGIAGMMAKTVVAPVDRIKILFQVSSAEFHLRRLPHIAMNIIRNEGVTALWKGNTATMIRVFPYSGVQFAVFDRCKHHFLRQHENQRRAKFGLTPLESLLSGMLAGTVSVMCTYPLDLTRAQLAVLRKHRHDGNTRGFVDVLLGNYRLGGVFGLFRGITPTLIGILPYSGIAFAINEQGKREIQHVTGRDLKTTERMQCGALSGLIAQSITYPIEVTRRRMQTLGLVGTDTALSSLDVPPDQVPARPPSLLSTIRSLYAEQGIRGFFKGVSMNWMKGPIAFSISFTAFDIVQSLMESESEKACRLPRV